MLSVDRMLPSTHCVRLLSVELNWPISPGPRRNCNFRCCSCNSPNAHRTRLWCRRELYILHTNRHWDVKRVRFLCEVDRNKCVCLHREIIIEKNEEKTKNENKIQKWQIDLNWDERLPIELPVLQLQLFVCVFCQMQCKGRKRRIRLKFDLANERMDDNEC